MLRIVRKPEEKRSVTRWKRSFFILLALLTAGAVLGILGFDPIAVYREMIVGSLGTTYRIQETVRKTIPLLIMGLGAAVCLRQGFFNIGLEGQFYMGATAAAYVALHPGSLPQWALLPLMCLAAAAAGGLYCLIPALFKIRWKISETLVTLMLNYIAVKIVTYLQYGPWKDPKAYGYPKIAVFPKAAQLPEVLGVHIGWIAALVFAGLLYLLINRSRFGYELRVMGDSPSTAKYAGMNTKAILLATVLIGGGLCGMAGMIQSSGAEHTLTNQLSSGLGFTALVVAWISRLQPLGIIAVSFLFAALLQGGSYLQTALQVPAATAEVVQGLLLLYILSSEFFSQYRVLRVPSAGRREHP